MTAITFDLTVNIDCRRGVRKVHGYTRNTGTGVRTLIRTSTAVGATEDASGELMVQFPVTGDANPALAEDTLFSYFAIKGRKQNVIRIRTTTSVSPVAQTPLTAAGQAAVVCVPAGGNYAAAGGRLAVKMVNATPARMSDPVAADLVVLVYVVTGGAAINALSHWTGRFKGRIFVP